MKEETEIAIIVKDNKVLKEDGSSINISPYYKIPDGTHYIKDVESWLAQYKSTPGLNDVARIISKENRYLILKRQKWKCNNCHETLKFNINSKWKGENAHIDHIHPYSKRDSYQGGKLRINELSNLQALCASCNLKKNTRLQ